MEQNYKYYLTNSDTENPLLYIFNEAGEIVTYKPVENGHYISSVDISTKRGFLILGTRNKRQNDQFGKFLVFKLNPDFSPAQKPVIACWQPVSVRSVCALTEFVFLAGGYDGNVYCYHLNEPQKVLLTFKAHNQIVTNIHKISSKVICTLGFDGYLRIWDMDSVNCVYENYSLTRQIIVHNPKILSYSQYGIIVALFPDGMLQVYEINNGIFLKKSLPNIGAIERVDDFLVVASLNPTKLVCYCLPDFEVISETPLFKNATSVIAKNFFGFVVIYQDGSAQQYSLNGTIQPGALLNLPMLVTGKGISKPEIELNDGHISERSRMLSQKAESLLLEGAFDELKGVLFEMVKNNQHAEALKVLAEWCRKNNHPLLELKALRDLCAVLHLNESTGSFFIRLAELLEQFNEPFKALEIYELINSSQVSDMLVEEKINRLKEIPEIPENALRDDLDAPDKVIQSLELYELLGLDWKYDILLWKQGFSVSNNFVDLHNLSGQFLSTGWEKCNSIICSALFEIKSPDLLGRQFKFEGIDNVVFLIEFQQADVLRVILRMVFRTERILSVKAIRESFGLLQKLSSDFKFENNKKIYVDNVKKIVQSALPKTKKNKF